jgi:hypothetical protein
MAITAGFNRVNAGRGRVGLNRFVGEAHRSIEPELISGVETGRQSGTIALLRIPF